MKSFYVFLLLAISGFSNATDNFAEVPGKNAEEISITKAPYVAIVTRADQDMPFMATIITKSFLLALGESFKRVPDSRENWSVYTGVTDLKFAQSENRHEIAELYFDFVDQNRLGPHVHLKGVVLIKLKKEINFNFLQKPIPLVMKSDIHRSEKEEIYLEVFTYKFTKREDKLETSATESNGRYKLSIYKPKNFTINKKIVDLTNSTFTINQDTNKIFNTCQNNSGAFAILDKKLVGLSEFPSGCQEFGGQNATFTGIAYQYMWIVYIIGRDSLEVAREQSTYTYNFGSRY